MIKKTVKKETIKKPIAAKSEEKVIKGKYIEAVGRRKTSVARVRLWINESGIKINGKDLKDYFKMPKLQELIAAPLVILELKDKHGFSAVVVGGGIASQAEAVRHGISRALIKLNEEFKKRLKKFDFLTRDSRMVERKKYGLKKARRAPQWAKR
jgi:small subunit ribosomal protein S9